jgi:hypothetical protein
MCDGDASPLEIEELSTLLDGNEPATREYLDYTTLHFHLRRRLRTAMLAVPEPDQVCELAERRSADAPTNPGKGSQRASIRWLAAPIIAASLLLGFAALFGELTPDSAFIARIVSAVDCEWDESRWASPQAVNLDVGHAIRVNQGLITIEFGDGAEVTLEAPVRFVVLAGNRGRLDFGKLTALVPERAHGFTVETPTSTIVDLGTNFGTFVAEDGSSETHVFEGNVLVRRDSENRLPEQWELVAGSALRIEFGGDDAKELTARPEAFVHSGKFTDPLGASVAKQLSLPSGGALVLWLDAARRLQLDDTQRVIGWGDIRTAENDAADNAWQVNATLRPTWIPDAFGIHPAVRFDGLRHLVTTSFATASDVTVVSVVQLPTNLSHGGTSRQILNLNGPPNLVLEHSPQNHIVGSLTSTLANQDSSLAGQLESSLPEGEAPVVIAYAYGHSENKSRLYVNGELADEGKASFVSAIRSPKFIGTSNSLRDSFVGDLGELLVFNSVLSAEQCMKLSADLMAKYGIEKLEREPRILLKMLPE